MALRATVIEGKGKDSREEKGTGGLDTVILALNVDAVVGVLNVHSISSLQYFVLPRCI